MSDYRALARRAAQRQGIDPNLFIRQIAQESGFQPHVVSRAGARGIAQFMPATARSLGVNPDDPNQALQGAARLMSRYLSQYGGDWTKALTAYNAGPGAVGRPLPGETQGYIRSILGSGPTATASGVSTPPFSRSSAPRYETVEDPTATRRVALARYLAKHDPDSSLLRLGILDPNGSTTKRIQVPGTGGASSGSSGSPTAPQGHVHAAMFDGKPVAPWIAAYLRYARQHGWQGTVTSGYRSPADQARIARTGANGANPVAAPGRSNHQFLAFPGGAVDVTAAAQLARILARKPGGSKLVYAGAKDPVHFSHPHNGGY